MSIFKTIGFEQLFNSENTPAGGIDRFGLPIKQLMIQLENNQLYILDQNNQIWPLSTKYASIKEIDKLKEEIGAISGMIKGRPCMDGKLA